MFEITFLCRNMRRSIAIVVLDIKVEARAYQQLQDIVALLVASAQVQSIVAMAVTVIDLDARFCQHAHNFAMAVLGGNPERVQSHLVLLIDVDHLVFKHEAHEFLTR